MFGIPRLSPLFTAVSKFSGPVFLQVRWCSPWQLSGNCQLPPMVTESETRSEIFPICGMKIRKTSNHELGGTRLRVSFLYYEECPSHDLALERLREVMAEESIASEV